MYMVGEMDSSDQTNLYEVHDEPNCGLWWDADDDYIEVKDKD